MKRDLAKSKGDVHEVDYSAYIASSDSGVSSSGDEEWSFDGVKAAKRPTGGALGEALRGQREGLGDEADGAMEMTSTFMPSIEARAKALADCESKREGMKGKELPLTVFEAEQATSTLQPHAHVSPGIT